jgi:hypothetical protein
MTLRSRFLANSEFASNKWCKFRFPTLFYFHRNPQKMLRLIRPAAATAHSISREIHEAYCQYVRSRVRYWMASATCFAWIFSPPSRSAIVRETRRIRS